MGNILKFRKKEKPSHTLNNLNDFANYLKKQGINSATITTNKNGQKHTYRFNSGQIKELWGENDRP